MATTEYNQDQSGLRPDLDEPRRTTENDLTQSSGFDAPQPQHKIHFDDEPLPKPTTGTYGDSTPSEPEQVTSTPGLQTGYGGDDVAPKSTEGYQDYRSSEPTGPIDASTPATTHNTAVDSPTPKKETFVQKIMDKLPGHHKTSTPETVEDDSTVDTGTPKKGLMTKIKERLPGHHSTTPTTAAVE